MMKKYVIGVIIFIAILLLVFGGYSIYSSNKSQDTVENLQSKADSEIAYLSTTIISMMNQLNNISYENYKIVEDTVSTEGQNLQSNISNEGSQTNSNSQDSDKSNSITNMNMNYSSILVNPSKKIDWNSIKKETEKMYQTWNTVLIDLNSLNINQDNLLKYSTVLDSITKSVQKKDKKTTLYNLANLYSLLVTYTKEYSKDNQRIILLDVRSNILYSYALIEDNKWADMKNNIKKAQNIYNNMMNNTLNNNNTTNINKAYVMLNEIYKSTDTKDKDIFYINYKNLMQELDIMEG